MGVNGGYFLIPDFDNNRERESLRIINVVLKHKYGKGSIHKIVKEKEDHSPPFCLLFSAIIGTGLNIYLSVFFSIYFHYI